VDVAAARLRDWQLELLEKLIEAEANLAARGGRDEFVCFFAQQDTQITHNGLSEPLPCGEEDVKALRAAGALQVNTSGETSWLFDLAPGAQALVESERAARGTPRPIDKLAALRSKVEGDQTQRRVLLRDLAEWFAEPIRWAVFISLAALAAIVAGVSLRVTDEPAALIVVLLAIGAAWGLLERLLGVHVLGLASAAHNAQPTGLRGGLRSGLSRPARSANRTRRTVLKVP
jgi:hypothetical protein